MSTLLTWPDSPPSVSTPCEFTLSLRVVRGPAQPRRLPFPSRNSLRMGYTVPTTLPRSLPRPRTAHLPRLHQSQVSSIKR